MFTKNKRCPRCDGINFSRQRPSWWSRWLLPNTRRYHCHGCHATVYLLPGSADQQSPAESLSYSQVKLK